MATIDPSDKKIIAELKLGPREEKYLADLVSESGSLSQVITELLHDDHAAKKKAKIQALADKMWPNGSPSERDER